MSTGAIVGVSAAAVVLLSLLVGPFLIPLPPLQGTSPVRQLAGPEGRFVVVDGVEVHYTSSGWGEPVFLLLHGFGASTFSWREVIAPLAAMGTVIAYDRPSSGLTARPMPGDWKGRSPYGPEAQAARSRCSRPSSRCGTPGIASGPTHSPACCPRHWHVGQRRPHPGMA